MKNVVKTEVGVFTTHQLVSAVTQIVNSAHMYGEGVKVLGHYDVKNNFFVLDYVFVPVGLRRKNIGTQIVQEFQELVAATGVPVKVLPSDTCGTPLSVLVPFYLNLGFTVRRGDEHMFYF